MCQFFRFGLHPYKLATLRATIYYHVVLSHKNYQNQGICYVTIAYCYVTKAFVARTKYPPVKVACNTKQVGQAWPTDYRKNLAQPATTPFIPIFHFAFPQSSIKIQTKCNHCNKASLPI